MAFDNALLISGSSTINVENIVGHLTHFARQKYIIHAGEKYISTLSNSVSIYTFA